MTDLERKLTYELDTARLQTDNLRAQLHQAQEDAVKAFALIEVQKAQIAVLQHQAAAPELRRLFDDLLAEYGTTLCVGFVEIGGHSFEKATEFTAGMTDAWVERFEEVLGPPPLQEEEK